MKRPSWWTVAVVAVAIGFGVYVFRLDDAPDDPESRCESWVERVDSGEAELTRAQEAAIRATLVIGKDAADALAFEATPMCETASFLQLVGPDGSLTPMAIYIAYECGVAPHGGKLTCELLD